MHVDAYGLGQEERLAYVDVSAVYLIGIPRILNFVVAIAVLVGGYANDSMPWSSVVS